MMRLSRAHARRLAALASVAILATGAVAAPAGAQELRTVELARQLGDTLPLSVRVDYAVGKVVVHGAEQNLLYQAQLAYDPRRTEPVYRYDAASRLLRLGVRKQEIEVGGALVAPELRLDLARVVPVDLRFEMGAAQADLDLGGMRLTRLHVEAGASDAVVHFDTPNLVPMELIALDLGAGSVTARGLANSRAREVKLTVDVGTANLDFGGDWTDNMELELQVLLGRTTVRVPDDVGIAVDMRRVLAAFDDEGFVRRGDTWYSANWDEAPRRLRIRGRTMLGRLVIERGAN